MSLSPFNYSGKSVLELHSWFKDVDDHLGAQNYDNGEWEPTITGLTGSPAVTATFQRLGKRCEFQIVIDGTQEMSDAEISLPLPVFGHGTAVSYSDTDKSPVGIGTINVDSGDVVKLSNYWVTDEKIIVSGYYEIEGI